MPFVFSFDCWRCCREARDARERSHACKNMNRSLPTLQRPGASFRVYQRFFRVESLHFVQDVRFGHFIKIKVNRNSGNNVSGFLVLECRFRPIRKRKSVFVPCKDFDMPKVVLFQSRPQVFDDPIALFLGGPCHPVKVFRDIYMIERLILRFQAPEFQISLSIGFKVSAWEQSYFLRRRAFLRRA